MSAEAGEALMKRTAVWVILFTVAAMAVMLCFASVKTVVIAEDVTPGLRRAGGAGEADERPLLLEDAGAGAVSLRIPLAEHIKPDDIVIENRYARHQIIVLIAGAPGEYYAQEKIGGNLSRVEGGSYSSDGDAAVLRFQMDGLYEYKYLFKNNALYLEFVRPRELYDKIVVLDAAHGGEDQGAASDELTEKDVTLDIVRRVRDQLEETDIRVYCTRQEDEDVSEQARSALANTLQADLMVSVHVKENAQAPETYGTITRYNPDYVIPYFGNAELADLLERTVSARIGGRGVGIAADREDALLNLSEVPSACLEIGGLTNAKEAGPLENGDYRQLAADGICEAIVNYYKEDNGARE